MQNTSEPIICEVNVNQLSPFRHLDNYEMRNNKKLFVGDIILYKDKVGNLKDILFESLEFKKIQLPYLFTLISCEIIYKQKHIDLIRLSGIYLSGIDIPSRNPQFIVWKTLYPPITSIDDSENLIINPNYKKALEETYFIAHWLNDKAYIYWSLEDNAEILTRPDKYPLRKWMKIEF